MLERQIRRTVSFFSRVPRTRILSGSLFLLAAATYLDYLTGLHYGFSLLYLFTVLFLTWFVNLEWGIAMSCLSIISWFLVRLMLAPPHCVLTLDFFVLTGEASVRLLFLLVSAYILHLLKKDFAIRAKQNEELVELGNLKNSFIGMVAHDLRNPISIIELSSSVLLDNTRRNLAADQLSLLEMIYKKSLYMMKLIEDYLDITKIEAGYLELNRSSADYRAFIEESVKIDEILASKKAIHIEVIREGDIPAFSFDRTKLSQVVNNLLLNALHYSKAESTVQIVLKVEGKDVVTEFIDSGPGVDAEDMDRLFEHFYRSKKRKEKGTGLGLAISKKIIEAHHGRIGFRNNPGAGSTFWFALPLE